MLAAGLYPHRTGLLRAISMFATLGFGLPAENSAKRSASPACDGWYFGAVGTDSVALCSPWSANSRMGPSFSAAIRAGPT